MPPVKRSSVKARKARSARQSTKAAQPAKSSSELTASKHKVIGLYGDSGIGKTRLLGTYEGRCLLIRSPVDHIDSILSAGMGKNIEERVVRTWAQMNDDLLPELRQDGAKWDLVAVDSWPLLQDVLMDDIWDTVLREKPERGRFGLDKQEYGINQLRMGNWMRHVVGADLFDLVWTAHGQFLPSPDLDGEGDPLEKLMPSIHGGKGAMAQKFCGYSKFIGYLRKDKKGRRILHTESDAVYYAKNQYSPSGEDWAMVNPTMPELLARIEAGPKRTSSVKKRRARKRPS